jgi:two-component system, chemotaxis family, protein-glutamate methylesterase/glutaminase
MPGHDIVVIGASAGGLSALSTLASRLPTDLKAAIFIVWHVPPHHSSILPEILNKAGNLPAAHATDAEPIHHARIYVAPSDYHLVLEADHVRITKGPKENRFRPAVDTLFRSASYTFGPRVIGIVLTGALDDGTAGLWAIKDRGGIAIVQDPLEAEQPSMPTNAKQNVKVDHCLEIAKIAEILPVLIGEPSSKEEDYPVSDVLEIETKIALEENALEANIMKLGDPSGFTCPECHGALIQINNSSLTRFRCHTGHSFSMRSLLTGVTESTEEALWGALRALDESIMLLTHMSQHAEEVGQSDMAKLMAVKAEEAKSQAKLIRTAVLSRNTVDLDFAEQTK